MRQQLDVVAACDLRHGLDERTVRDGHLAVGDPTTRPFPSGRMDVACADGVACAEAPAG